MGPEFHKIETLFERDESFKVNPSKIKNPCYDLITEWDWTEKIDGTNIRIHWNHLENKVTVGGRTDNASIPADLVKWVYENVSLNRLRDVFPDASVTLYGEGYGAGIQKGGGYSKDKRFILFDVLVETKWWLNQTNICDVGAKLDLEVVPLIGRMTLAQAIDMVRTGFNSRLGEHPPAEGLVGRPPETMFDKNHNRLIVKLKTKDF